MTTSTRNAAPSIVREERIKERESLVTKHCKYYLNNYYNKKKIRCFHKQMKKPPQTVVNQSINQSTNQSINAVII